MNDWKDVLPETLIDAPNWCGAKLWMKDGKLAKLPIDMKNGELAKSNDPSTWCSFDTAVGGLGELADCLMIRLPDDVGMIDFDKIPGIREDRKVNRFVRSLNTYWEYSPSGNGLHGLCRVTKPITTSYSEVFSTGLIELYSGRFCTVTGDYHEASKPVLVDATDFIQEHFPKLYERKEVTLHQLSTGFTCLTDEQVLRKAKAAKNGENFDLLWCGAYNVVEPAWTHSEADLALCCNLVFWCNGDVTQIDRLFRLSALYRKKWDKASYRTTTIRKALQTTVVRYDGSNEHKTEDMTKKVMNFLRIRNQVSK